MLTTVSKERVEQHNRAAIDGAINRAKGRDSYASPRGFGRMPVRRKACNPFVTGMTETINQPMYDSVSFAAGAAMARTVLFQNPIGQAGKTLAQTNMTVGGQLPAPNSLVVTSIKVYISNNTTLTDLQNLLANVSFNFHCLTKPYFQGPLVLLPAAMGGVLTATAVGAPALFSSSNGAPDPRASYNLTIPVPIGAQEGFNVTLNPETGFNFAAAGGGTLGVGATILVVLDGELTRGVS
jgi:hypothetical protein